MFKEIPFIDAPEGAYAHTVRPDRGILNPQQWEEKRPELVCVDTHGWATIRENWLRACLYAGPECNVMVNSVDLLVRKLDALAKEVIEAAPPGLHP